jgi:hypothetical protein
MSCAGLEYAHIWSVLGVLFGSLRSAVGDDALAVLLLAVPMVALVKTLEVAEGYIRPKVVAFVINDIRRQARDWLNRGLTFLGFNLYAATVSLVVGTAYYFCLKAALRFPTFWYVSIPTLITAFVGVAIVAFAVRGNVPKDWNSRWRYCKRFYVPTVGGISLVAVNTLSDLFVSLLTSVAGLVLFVVQS